jgi:uncharacterized protein YjeT (DUF2065 family)
MTIVALVISTIALLVSVVTALSLVEVFEGLKQVRELTGLNDASEPVDIAKAFGTPPVAHGISFGYPTGILLFVSPKCASCHALAATFAKNPPARTHVVITAGQDGGTWADEYKLSSTSYTIDRDQSIADRVGITATPVAVLVHEGLITRAATAPSRRAFDELLAEAEGLISSKSECEVDRDCIS